MTDSEITPSERTHGARRLFGYTVSLDPHEAFDTMGSPLPSRLSHRATTFVVESARQYRGEEFHSSVVDLLRNGINDTQNFLHKHLVRITETQGAHKAEAFATHDRTTRSIAVLALRTEESMQNLISILERDRQDTYFPVIGDDVALDTNNARITPNTRSGCPFAGHDGEIDIDPLFKRFSDWTGRLCVASIAHNLKR